MSPVLSRQWARLRTTSLSQGWSKHRSTGGQPPNSTLVQPSLGIGVLLCCWHYHIIYRLYRVMSTRDISLPMPSLVLTRSEINLIKVSRFSSSWNKIVYTISMLNDWRFDLLVSAVHESANCCLCFGLSPPLEQRFLTLFPACSQLCFWILLFP